MRMYFKERILSILDSYDIYDEDGRTLFTVKGKWGLSHRFAIYDRNNIEVGYIEEKILTLFPKFYIYANGKQIGMIRRRFTVLRPLYTLDELGWEMTGDIFQWDFTIRDSSNRLVADITKKLLSFSDTYWIDVPNEQNALVALMFILAVDAEQCSRDS